MKAIYTPNFLWDTLECMITYDDFKKVELKVVRVLRAERIEGSEKLVRLAVDVGGEERQIIAGIGKRYTPEELVGKHIVIVANLEPRSLMGLESNGMVLAASGEDGPIILIPERGVSPGAVIT